MLFFFFFSSRRRHTRCSRDWSSDVCSSDLYPGLARVRAALRIPLASGENEATVVGIRAIIDAGAADIVQPSVTKVGGILEMKKIATLAAATGVTFVPHSYYYGPDRKSVV